MPGRPGKSRAPAGLLLAAWLGTCPRVGGGAPLIEEVLAVPVHSRTSTGVPFEQPMTVASVHAQSPRRLPFLILLHGRAPDAAARARLSVKSYPSNTRYFAEQGFAVFIPVRVGYGATAGPDAEFTGNCDFKRFAEGVAPALVEIGQLMEYAAQLPYVDASRGVIIGESFGGLIAIAAAAAKLPGLQAVVNIAGGDGGDAVQHPDHPCRPDQLRDVFASYGSTAKIPSLWVYSANDRLWGPDLPREWFGAFTVAGGNGRFEGLPADKNNGHFIFMRNSGLWRPVFERFLAPLNLAGSGAR